MARGVRRQSRGGQVEGIADSRGLLKTHMQIYAVEVSIYYIWK